MKLLFTISLACCILMSASAFVTPTTKTTTTTTLWMADGNPARPSPPAPQSKQAEYGQSLELPGTYVRCGRCQTVYAISPDDLGNGKGRRLECGVCQHSWFQSRERILNVRDDFEMIPLPEMDKERIAVNLREGKQADFMGEVKLYVGNISFECKDEDLLEVFQEVGTVGDISLVKDNLGRNRGFGFVTMRKKEDGDKAMEQLDGTSIRGRNIAVRESNS